MAPRTSNFKPQLITEDKHRKTAKYRKPPIICSARPKRLTQDEKKTLSKLTFTEDDIIKAIQLSRKAPEPGAPVFNHFSNKWQRNFKTQPKPEEPEEAADDSMIESSRAKKRRKKKAMNEYKIFLGNVDFSTHLKSVRDAMKRFGQVKDVIAPGKSARKDGNMNSGFYFVCFGTAEAMEAALKTQTVKIDQRTCYVRSLSHKDAQLNFTAQFEGVNSFMNKIVLRNHFEFFGETIRVLIHRSSTKGSVSFYNKDALDKCLKENVHTVSSCKLRVFEAVHTGE